MSTDSPVTSAERLFAGLQWLLPTHLLSRAMHALARSRLGWLKTALIRAFLLLFRIDLGEAQIRDPGGYESFNAFFTRALRQGVRPLPADEDILVSPIDGRLGQFGAVTTGRLTQAKGQSYGVTELLGGREDLAAAFLGGHFATLYLAPYNYHRVHMPIAGVLRETCYVPGRLFGVNPASVRSIPRLFTRNERLAVLFDSAVGPVGMVLVGAFCVGSIETVWAGEVTPSPSRILRHDSFPTEGERRSAFDRGAEMGRFNLGSTVILLLGPGAVDWNPSLAAGQSLRLGDALGRVRRGS